MAAVFANDLGYTLIEQPMAFTEEQLLELGKLCEAQISDLLKNERGEDEGWYSRATLNGVTCQSRPDSSGGPFVITKGMAQLEPKVPLDFIRTQFSLSKTSEEWEKQIRASDPMCLLSAILANCDATGVPEGERVRIIYAAFKIKGPGIWDRDFLFVQHLALRNCETTGERLFMVVCFSLQRPEVPDMVTSAKRVRGEILGSGYVFREDKDTKAVKVTYVVQANPHGALPVAVVNMASIMQAGNAGRIRDLYGAHYKAAVALERPCVSWYDLHARASYRYDVAAGDGTLILKCYTQGANIQVRLEEKSAAVVLGHKEEPTEDEKNKAAADDGSLLETPITQDEQETQHGDVVLQGVGEDVNVVPLVPLADSALSQKLANGGWVVLPKDTLLSLSLAQPAVPSILHFKNFSLVSTATLYPMDVASVVAAGTDVNPSVK